MGPEHEDLARLGGFGESRGDIDVDAEVVASDLARAAQMNAGSKSWHVAIDLDRGRTLARDEGRLCGARGVPEDGHQAVAESLDDLATPFDDRRLDRLAHGAQQFDRRLVAGFQCPAREADDVGEQNRDVNFSAPAALGLADPLPQLERRQPKLSQHARRVAPQGSKLARCEIGGTTARGREPVDELLIAQDQLRVRFATSTSLGWRLS